MENMKEMLDQEEMNLDVHKGSVVEGKVIEVLDDKAYISFGYKTEAVLQAHEYSYPAPASLKDVLKVGDTLRVQVVSGVKEDSTIYVSKIKVDRLADWDVVEEAFQKGERNKDALLTIVKNEIEEEPMSDINYVEMYEMPGLAELPETIEGNALLAVAVRFGKTRLIDNVILEAE